MEWNMIRPERRYAEIFGANVRRRREWQGLNQRDYSKRLGIAQATLSVVETGAVNLTRRSMTRMAEAAGINLKTMFEP
jgi:transcriptional regulator with XRE-family HTH domain